MSRGRSKIKQDLLVRTLLRIPLSSEIRMHISFSTNMPCFSKARFMPLQFYRRPTFSCF